MHQFIPSGLDDLLMTLQLQIVVFFNSTHKTPGKGVRSAERSVGLILIP
jgi:hypothetical protein